MADRLIAGAGSQARETASAVAAVTAVTPDPARLNRIVNGLQGSTRS